jgi:alpha-tubulin suppressor-like RCC1 family protein
MALSPVALPGVTTAIAVSVGYQHSCALLADTTVKCWGGNDYGQLGNGTFTPLECCGSPLAAVSVLGITGAIAISAGYQHSCALLADTTVKCWGYNYYGQLGNGTNAGYNTGLSTAVTVSGITGATAISAGRDHSCALLADTTVNCWGLNDRGQLGDGTTTNSSTPMTVTNVSGAAAIGVGLWHSCALLADHTLKCWGGNESGGLGNGTTTDSNTPVSVIGL